MSKLVGNEQAKLTATYLNGFAIAIGVVGVFAPLVSQTLAPDLPATPLQLAFVVGCCAILSVALHYGARMFLKRMTE